MKPRDSTPPYLPSPLRFFLTVLAIVFLAEAAVTLFLPLVLQYMHGTVGAIADAAMLTVLSAPFLWWLIVRPLRSLAVAEHIRAATIISRALDGIITINEQELVTSVNPAAERLFGYGADEVVGQPLTPLIPERYRDAYQRGLERIRSAEKSDIIGKTIELHGLRKDGSEFPLELSVATWQADEHTFYTGIIRDVTERKRAEQEISNLAKFPAENPQPVLRLNPDGLVLYANEASQALLREWNCDVGGHAPKRWSDLLSDAATSQAKKAHDMECGDRTYMFLLAPILDAGYVNLYGMDITERKRTEEALVRRTRQLEAVRAVTAEITRELDLPAVLSLIIRRAVELAGAKSGAVYLWDEAAQVLVPQVWHGLGDWIKAIRLRLGEGLSGAVAQRRAGMIVNDYRGSPYAQPLFLDQSEVTAVLAEPLLYRDQLLGVITIDNEETGRAFSGEDREVMALFATQAAIAIENARLHEMALDRAQQLATLNELTRRLTTALEPQAVGREILAAAQVLIPGVAGRLWGRAEPDGALDLVSSVGLREPEGGHTLRLHPGEGVIGIAVATRQPVISPEVTQDPRFINKEWAAVEGLVSCIVLPLVWGDQVNGGLAIFTREPHDFTDGEVGLLRSFADQAAIAIENARLYSGTQAREREATKLSTGLRLLNQASRALHRTLDVDAMLTGTLDELAQAFGAGAALVHVFSDEGVARSVGHWLSEAHGRAITYRPGGISERVRQTRAPLVLRDICEARDIVHPAHFVHGVKSLAAFPIVGQQPEVLGVLFLYYPTPQEFPESELSLLATYADHLAIALENARLYAASEARAIELATLREIGQAITTRLDLAAVLEAVVAGAMRLLDNPFAQIILWDEATQTLRFGAAQGPDAERVRAQTFALGRGINGTVAQTRQPMILDDYQASPHAVPECADIVATITVPILFGDRLLGILHSHTTESGRRFITDDLRLFQMLATQAAIAIENARLYEQIRRHAAELDDRVKARTAELEEALRVKAQFLANMSHELRTPLNAVLGFSEVLLGRSPGDITPKQERYLRQIQAGGQRLLTLVTDLLEMTGTEGLPSFHFDRVAVQDLVGEVLEPLAGAARAKQVEMETHLDLSLPVVVADRRKLAQILHHLLTNAIRYTSAGGRVTVTTRRLESAAVLLSGGAAVGLKEPQRGNTAGPQDWVEIRVTDTGIGIRAENLERIFRGFEQVDSSDSRQYGGAGLGLALVRRLAELHGGRVWAESDGEGRGARFIVRLPLLSAPPPPRVLVVEDEALLRAQMVEALREAGFTVLEAPTGTEALAALDGQSPDLLVLDIVLPDMEGWEVLARVRDEGRTRALPVLILTGVDSVQADEAVARGADEFLTKPVSAQVLVETVGRLLRRPAAH